MKTKIFILILIILSILFSTAITLAELISNENEIQLVEGENQITIPESVSPFYVSDLMKSYPEILTITYFEFEKEIGYANIFGGVGENFIIYPTQEYTFTVNKDMEVKLR